VPEPVLARARALLGELEKGAALPSGTPASLRARTKAAKPQLGLFEVVVAAPSEPHPALDTLRAVDVDRLTPLEALQLVASLKKMAQTP
jgi:DNA mismatch repair protein MutS